MPIDVEALTLSDVLEWISVHDDYDTNQKYFNGNHWRKGKGWVGPMPSRQDMEGPGNYDEMYRRVKDAFVSQNKIREVVERHVGAILGTQPEFDFTPVQPEGEFEEEQQRQEEEAPTEAEQATRYLENWFDRRNVHVLLMKVGEQMLLGEQAGLRLAIPEELYVPEDAEDEDQSGEIDREEAETFRVPGMDFEQALNAIFPDLVRPNEGGTETDRRTMREYTVWKDPEDDVAEVSFTDRDGMTVLGVVDNDGIVQSDPMDLNGNLLMKLIQRPIFVTPQIRQQQETLNKVLTMMSVNLDWSGFLERIFMNTQRPVQKKRDAQGNVIRGDDGEPVYEKTDYSTGPGRTFFATGVTYKDREGNQQVKDPSVVFRDPVPVDVFEDSKRVTEESLLSEARQKHALIAGDATPSGDSRRQAMADFVVSLVFTKIAIERLGRWLVETVLLFAAEMSEGGSPVEGEYDWRATFRTHVDVGPITIEEANFIVQAVENQIISRRSALMRIGVDDVSEEMQQIREDIFAQTALEKEQAEVVASYTASGMQLQNALQAVGYDEEEALELVQVDGPPMGEGQPGEGGPGEGQPGEQPEGQPSANGAA